jgi:hypothetical protein
MADTAVIIAITAAVVEALNDATLSQPFVAVRDYAATFKLDAMAELHVTVIPAAVASDALDRESDEDTVKISIGVQQKLDPFDAAHADPLVFLCEEIRLLFRRSILDYGGETPATCTDVVIDPVFDVKHARQMKLFMCPILLTYQLAR